MAQRHILFTVNHAPFGSIFYTEGLRAVLGATSGTDEHTVDVVYLGDGAYFGLKKVNRADSVKYIHTLGESGYRLKVEHESLAARGIAAEEVADDIEVISRDAVGELLTQADFTVGF
ncbi:MAG: DsrE family protein [Candidatus Methylomirabilales bacterium]